MLKSLADALVGHQPKPHTLECSCGDMRASREPAGTFAEQHATHLAQVVMEWIREQTTEQAQELP